MLKIVFLKNSEQEKHASLPHNDLFLTHMNLTNKLNSYGGDAQIHFDEDYQQVVHTIPSINGTIITVIFNKIPNKITSWNGTRYRLRFSTC